MNVLKIIKSGLWDENPCFVQVIAMCPLLAVTTTAINGLGMGLATTAVLAGSNVAISLLRRFIPDQVRLPSYMVIIATFVTIIESLLKAYLPALDQSLGIFIPLIVVNCIIFARAELFAFRNPPLPSLVDGLAMGLGFTIALVTVSVIRELLGNGTFFDVAALPEAVPRTVFMILPPGAFITLGSLIALINYLKSMQKERERAERKRLKRGAQVR